MAVRCSCRGPESIGATQNENGASLLYGTFLAQPEPYASV